MPKNLSFFWLVAQDSEHPDEEERSLTDSLQKTVSTPIQKGFIRKNVTFWHILPKRGNFIRKNWEFFAKRGGSRPIQKILIRKNWGGQKRGRGGVSVFLLKVKKQFFYGSPYVQIGQGIQNLGPLEIVEQCRGHWCTRGSKGAPGGSRVPPAPKRVIKQQNNGPKPWFKVPSVSRGIWVH